MTVCREYQENIAIKRDLPQSSEEIQGFTEELALLEVPTKGMDQKPEHTGVPESSDALSSSLLST